jgi:hypothetical protein
VIFGLNALMVAAARDQVSLVPGAIAAGLVADGLLRVLRPSPVRAAAFRAFAFAVPAVYFTLYFAGLALTRGVWWSLPLWSGAIVLAGTVGWLASWLVAPPAVDAGDDVSDAPRESHAAERHSVRY